MVSRNLSTRYTTLHPTCLSYNPSSRPKPSLINNMYVEHLLETADDEIVKHEIRLAIMDERMRREECILATSPHKVVANAVKYARAMNYTLGSLLEKRIKILHDEFEQEFRRIVNVQQEAFRSTYRSGQRGYTRKQFKRTLSDVLTTKQRENDLRRARTEFSLPSMSVGGSSTSNEARIQYPKQKIAWRRPSQRVKVARLNEQRLVLLPWKHDSDAVYLPPI